MSAQPHPAGVRLLPWRISPWVIDALIITIAVVGFLRRPFAEGVSFEAADWVALVASVVFLLTRRHFPLATLVVAVVASVAIVTSIDRPSMVLPVSLIVLFTVGLESDRRTAVVAGTITTVVFSFVTIVLLEQGEFGGAGLASIAWPAFAVAAGIGVRASRGNMAAAQERARRAEQSRELEAQRRVIEERLRIARDVHDLVAHHIAVINVQSGVASHLIESDPVAADEALRVVRNAASTVVDQLGELLGVLRSPDDTDDPTAPTPDFDAIEDLISSFSASGLDIRRETSGTRRELSGSAELAAYRVVQEALTNAHKYGDGTATVALRFDDDGLEVSIVNPTGSAVAQGTGLGLIGMRERVEAVGGSLTARTSGDSRRFEITALIPGRVSHE